MLFVLFATTIIANISIINIAPQLSAAAQDTVQDPSQLSAQITQAQEDIRKELIEQGQIISNDIVLTQEPGSASLINYKLDIPSIYALHIL
jgi:2-phospho-L-lactate guanylyltransferase (CobY/MobA/RfbA family)